jgi:hypothetical protein
VKSIYGVVILILCLLTYFFIKPMLRGELGQKPVYAALQGVELEKRNNLSSLLYEERGKYQMVGIISADRMRIWIVLNELIRTATSTPSLKWEKVVLCVA